MNKTELTLFAIIRNNCPYMSEYLKDKCTETELNYFAYLTMSKMLSDDFLDFKKIDKSYQDGKQEYDRKKNN